MIEQLIENEKPPVNPFYKNRFEICYHLISSAIAAALILVGALSSGGIDTESIIAASMAALAVFIVKIRDYWDAELPEYREKRCYSRLSSILTFF